MDTPVGIVIPCFNEEKYIADCLRSIMQSDYPSELIQVKVVDGMSTDGTRDIVSELATDFPQIELIDNAKRTAPYAMNIGIRALDTPVVIILGGHSEVYPDFISMNMRTLDEQPDVSCVGGRCENIYASPQAEIIGAAMSSRFGVGDVRFRTGGEEGPVDTVAFGAYRKEIFERVGLFDEELSRNQDDELNYRVTSSGAKIWYSAKIRYKYHVRSSFAKLFKQYYQYGFWKVKVNRKHGTITTWRQVVPALFVSYLIIQVIGLLFSPWAVYGLFFLGLYLLLACVSAFKASSRAPHLVLYSFLILHVSYGWGYLRGIFSRTQLKEPSISR